MAFGFSFWFFLLCLKGYFASNNVSSTQRVLSSPASIVTSLPLSPSATASSSKFHVSVSSSILQSSPSRIPKSEGVFHRTATEMSLTVSTLFSTSVSDSTLLPSSSVLLGYHNRTQTSTASILAVNSSLASNVSAPTLPTQMNSTTEEATSSQTRESLLSGQLAGVALILFILVVLLLIICLGNFADEPVFNERELFTEEVSMKNLGKDMDNQGQQGDEDWKFDPLFAWSPRKSFDSKL